VEFYIELMPGVALALKVAYNMSTPKLVELKLKLKEMIDKEYIIPCVFPWSASILFVNKKDDTLRLGIDYR